MRIALLNSSCYRVGGTESYLHELVPYFDKNGIEVALVYETDRASSRDLIALPEKCPRWCAEHLGTQRVVAELAAWQPDLLYGHGLQDPVFETALQRIAVGIFFAHNYSGACISGSRTHSFPTPQPCDRIFGPGCLACYFPRRCGGLNPLTMIREYRLQSQRTRVLSKYALLLTHSAYVQSVYQSLGLTTELISYYAAAGNSPSNIPRLVEAPARWRLLFLGRMERLKGGRVLLDALPSVRKTSKLPLHVIFAGDGPERSAWEEQSDYLRRTDPGLSFDFPGWISTAKRDELLAESDLLIVPSLWPEPFGRVGPEAGSLGLPVVAFDVGGISDWLTDGENGILAPGNPPTAAGLAKAISEVLTDFRTHQRLSEGGVRLARRFSMERHFEELIAVFHRVLRNPSAKMI